MGSIERVNYTPPPTPTRCRDCGESLDEPHVLGPHLPGCVYYPQPFSPTETTHSETADVCGPGRVAPMRQILACVPVDRSKLPQVPELHDIVITDLYTLKPCAGPGCGDVWVGPRQMATFSTNPDGFIILCYLCAVVVQGYLYGPLDPDEDVVHLGGGYPVEGRARIS
jgi:hypothetical protein